MRTRFHGYKECRHRRSYTKYANILREQTSIIIAFLVNELKIDTHFVMYFDVILESDNTLIFHSTFESFVPQSYCTFTKIVESQQPEKY